MFGAAARKLLFCRVLFSVTRQQTLRFDDRATLLMLPKLVSMWWWMMVVTFRSFFFCFDGDFARNRNEATNVSECEKKMRNLHDMQDGGDRLQCNVWCFTFMDHVKVDRKVCEQVDLAWKMCTLHTAKAICWMDTSVSVGASPTIRGELSSCCSFAAVARETLLHREPRIKIRYKLLGRVDGRALRMWRRNSRCWWLWRNLIRAIHKQAGKFKTIIMRAVRHDNEAQWN